MEKLLSTEDKKHTFQFRATSTLLKELDSPFLPKLRPNYYEVVSPDQVDPSIL